MINKAFHIFKNMGMRYTLYRVRHELEKRTGVLKKRHPVYPVSRTFIPLDEWRCSPSTFIIPDREKLDFKKLPNQSLNAEAQRILKGEIKFFSSEWKALGRGYDWITNPLNGYRYDINKHWSEIPDFSPSTGDIKQVWEKSRFAYLLTIMRSDFHHDEDHAEFIFSEIENWIDANPVNRGPNWRCSQETSLRVFNWCFVLSFYRFSEALTEERWRKIQNTIYWSLHHVFHHIDFSRIAVRNNHAITETLFLLMSELLFPFIPETKEWSRKGRKWFEEEIGYQIYEDGTFLQFSMNYHRVVVQLLSLGFSLARKHDRPFTRRVYDRAYKSVNFLYQCMQDEKGYLPNHGANDGAWFFPLSDTDYRDFRPQLNTLHCLLTGVNLFEEEVIGEEACWMGLGEPQGVDGFLPIEKNNGIMEFSLGGYYLIRDEESFSLIKCTNYKDRPSHADNLHLDVWFRGENVLVDGGSFLYNTEESVKKYFSGTESHNTVMLGENDQMRKGPRFTWFNWTRAMAAEMEDREEEFVFTGAVKCFGHVAKGIIHRRVVIKKKGVPVWIVRDEVVNKPALLPLRQLWHTTQEEIDFEHNGNSEVVKEGWRSLYYGMKEEIKMIEFSTNEKRIETTIDIKAGIDTGKAIKDIS